MDNQAQWFHFHLCDAGEHTTQGARQLNRTENVGPAITECRIKYFLFYFSAFPNYTYKVERKKKFYPGFSVLLK